VASVDDRRDAGPSPTSGLRASRPFRSLDSVECQAFGCCSVCGIEPGKGASMPGGGIEMPRLPIASELRVGDERVCSVRPRAERLRSSVVAYLVRGRAVSGTANGGRARGTFASGRTGLGAEGVPLERRAFARESVSRETGCGEVGSWTAGVVAPGLAAFRGSNSSSAGGSVFHVKQSRRVSRRGFREAYWVPRPAVRHCFT